MPENTFFFDKVAGPIKLHDLSFIKKEALAQVFSCEFCKISNNTFSCRTSPVASSWALSKVSINVVFQQKCCIF